MHQLSTKITFLGLIVIATANAAQIQIGDGANGVNGLTNSWITTGDSSIGATGTYTEQNYNTNLFSGALNGVTAPVPYVGYTQGSASTGTLTDGTNAVTFAMINDGVTGGNSNNVWIATSTGNSKIVIPVGVFGVTDVWTMLNTELGGASPLRDATVAFVFDATDPTGLTGTLTTYTFKLGNSANGSTPTGQVMNAVDCVTGCTGTGGYGSNSGANGPTLASSSFTGATVLTNTLYTSAYTSAVGNVLGTTGNLVLSDQGFFFSGADATTAASQYLVSMSVKETGTSGAGSSLAVSALTVDTVPEPSTVFLLLSGLGAVGFGRFRRRK